ncbi:MAG: hypothetical protein VX388_02330 [Pseudomonadota bacterium]|nr:hypothetical protein [Pseudomonadota bacterium]MEC8526628.1 hypothetical protein [Pseudomonadota bacterium]MED5355574.1 hypothetical protein [Pseudomonadota bacterium]MEE3095292.1 hypothetical protein [Pseudomonadota bacterium]|tara:strand:- start:1512 stop:1691 length:180 start_codon:yes stop_codon:yes gene_type:complete
MRVLLFRITRLQVIKVFWITAISTILQSAIPAHAHDDIDPNFGSQIEAGTNAGVQAMGV